MSENTVSYKLVGRNKEVSTNKKDANGKIVKDADGKPVVDWKMSLVMKVPEVRNAAGDKVDFVRTLRAWGEYLGAELACGKLEEYMGIRFIDRARSLHTGGKSVAAMSDEQIRKAMRDWSFKDVRIAQVRKSPTELMLEECRAFQEATADENELASLRLMETMLMKKLATEREAASK